MGLCVGDSGVAASADSQCTRAGDKSGLAGFKATATVGPGMCTNLHCRFVRSDGAGAEADVGPADYGTPCGSGKCSGGTCA